jgi:Protein of unknown function (DUF1302)
MRRSAAAALAVLLAGGPASAFEFFDGRIQAHGYGEVQMRAIARNMNWGDPIDLTQWYNVLDVELDLDPLPDGWGPFDVISGFVRAEARYDCVWTRGCGVFPSANTFGDRSQRLPGRLVGARRTGLTGATFTGDVRPIHIIPIDELGFSFKDDPVPGRNDPAYLWHVPGVDTLFGIPGEDGVTGTADDPAFYTFQRYVEPGAEYRFALRNIPGPKNGQDLQVLGPWEPRNEIVANGALADRANPFNPNDVNPITGTAGSAALPYRPAPLVSITEQPPSIASPRGLNVPNEAVASLLEQGAFGDFDENFSQSALAWNRGGSQQDEYELKEAYVDLEFLESRLWLRLGKQNIVWGKTELFRTTDQFNPQDLALSSLPSLEESRIPLWSARGVYSLYGVGPLQDVRLELAMNYDDFEPADIGRCGEPYTPNPACNKTAGLFAHGLVGFGLAGEVRPPDPWQDTSGIEFGGRVEFRWQRFSFAISDFYGYEDFPYVDPVFFYERNVDPRTGRPRRGNSTAGCDPDGLYDGDVSGCLGPNDDALFHHAVNQERFAVICSSSVGFSDLDRSACAQSVFNSTAIANGSIRVVTAIGDLLGGTVVGAAVLSGLTGIPPAEAEAALSPLNADPSDCLPQFGCGNVIPGVADPVGDPFVDGPFLVGAVENFLTNEQEALLGCGPIYGTPCSFPGGGMDLLNAEMSVLIQAWPGFPGTRDDWDATDAGLAQPGTVGFFGGPVATRYEGGKRYILPGARGPGDPGYDVNVDGSPAGLSQPFTAQPWQNEMAGVSWNLLMAFVALSGLGVPEADRTIDEFVPSQPFRSDGCSFSRPQLCQNVQAFYAVSHTTRRTVDAGGNDAFGRVDFDWHVAGSGVLRYAKRNVLGFSMDFPEDRTKTNWSVESTWIGGVPFVDNDSPTGITDAQTFNLTVSVDRPTFVNFLNANRTFFINSQWFFQYVSGYRGSFPTNGPVNVLATLTFDTGYWNDRLLPAVTFVYDFQSNSGAALPSITYRYTENFSVGIALSWFWGTFQKTTAALATVSDPPFRTGSDANVDFVENGLSPIMDRDEISLVLRYTF